jgi:hypothetical protein
MGVDEFSNLLFGKGVMVRKNVLALRRIPNSL